MHAVLTDGVAASPPFPYIDGPLFAVSRALADALVADSIPRDYLSELGQRYDSSGPKKVFGMSCWPTTDSIFGFWTTAVALRTRRPVTLVNSPQNGQHLSWPSWKISNTTIVMHGIRSVRNERFKQYATVAGSGTFKPYERECGACGDMGWVTWPDSPLKGWRCCGNRVNANGSRLKACTGKACPNVAVSVLRAVHTGPGDGLVSEYAGAAHRARTARAARTARTRAG